ncbi:glycerophosphodiester phosphodiesterase family protein [Sulfurovum sp. CS9]|uniref:glycerophosphodiester phosphodiesterase family protein n=1 Tax=Sulfurovum sp. CS9 TaxID=3391146 RepID=UPI0039E894FF
MTEKNENIWEEVLSILRSSSVKFFALHLMYIALGLILFAPLMGIIGRFLLSLSGEAVLSDMDIAMFMLSPPGILALIVLSGLLITILIFEQASMMALSATRLHEQNMGVIAALRFTFNHAKGIYLFATRLIIRILVIVVPFIAISAAIAWVLITDHDINYYLAEKPPVFMLTLAINGLIMFAMLFILVRKLLSWSLALPLILFSGVSPADSFDKSTALAKGHKSQILKSFALWALAAFLLGAVVLGTVHFLGAQLIPLFNDSLKVLIVLMGALVALLSLANIFVTALTSSSLATLTVILAERYGCHINISDMKVKEEGAGLNLTRTKITLLLITSVTAAVLTGGWLLKDIQTVDNVDIIAHRGAAGAAPENTIAALRKAIEDKADWVEIDVQETKDGEIVVIHDSDFMKISKVPTKVWEGTLEELRQIDIGSWFDPKFSDQRIPTLEEVLLEAKGKAKVLIELKYYGHDEQLEQRVIDVVEKVGMAKSVALMSLELDGVKKARALRPDWEMGILLSLAIGDISKMDVDFFAINMDMIKPNFVRRVHKIDKKVYIWTANDPVSMTSMISLGVDGLITDEPKMGQNVLTQRDTLGTVERLLLHTTVLLGEPIPKRVYRDESP